MALMRLICNGSLNLVPLRKHYSADLCDLLASMLRRSGSERPSFKQLLQHEFVGRTLQRLNPVPALPADGDATGVTREVGTGEVPSSGKDQVAMHGPSACKSAARAALAKPIGPAANKFEALTRPDSHAHNPFNSRSASLPPSARSSTPQSALPSPRPVAVAAAQACGPSKAGDRAFWRPLPPTPPSQQRGQPQVQQQMHPSHAQCMPAKLHGPPALDPRQLPGAYGPVYAPGSGAHGAEAHAAADVIRQSFFQRQRAAKFRADSLAQRPAAGMPSRQQERPAWARRF